MDKMQYLTVAAFQGPIQEGKPEANLEKVLEITALAEKRDVDLLCFPESYLHGYFSSRKIAQQHAIDLQSDDFKKLCARFQLFQHTTVLLGLNEIDGHHIYNTVVVIEKGKCLGKYRKAYSYVPYDYYSLGHEFPIFEKKGIKYGIVICLDSVHREPAYIAALKGARILFCPMFNRVEKDPKMLAMMSKMFRREHFVARAFDNYCWFVASDITWDEKDEVCPGFACILNDSGEFVARAEAFQSSLLTYAISLNHLQEHKKGRLLGNPELVDIVNKAYQVALSEEKATPAKAPVDTFRMTEK